jgi:hypothetical protein
VSFATITLCVASQRVFVVCFLLTQSGNFWLHPHIYIYIYIYLSSDLDVLRKRTLPSVCVPVICSYSSII